MAESSALPSICLCSVQDLAAQTIKQQLLTLFPFTKTSETFDSYPIYQLRDLSLVTLQSDSVYADHLDQRLTADLFIFASRHKSAAFRPALLAHSPGNWADADLGGKAATLCIAHPTALKAALHTLLAERLRLGLQDWGCGLEATHHGPWIENTPVLFVEIGSSEAEWQNETAAAIVARAIVAAAENRQHVGPSVLGFGGPHYCPTFTRIVAETEWAISHILPKYHLDHASEALIRHAMARTVGQVSSAVLDWKGMTGPQRDRLVALLSSMDVAVLRDHDVLHGQAEKRQG
jgi:D-aminoacyl-tRNA deacylase